MRLFVGLAVRDDVRARIDAAIATFRDGADHLRFTPPGTWHLTLAFLGEVEPDAVGVVEGALRRAAIGHAPFDVALAGPGRFGRGLLFLGVDDRTYADVTSLGTSVRTELAAAGVGFDDKPLHPHLTLARQRDRKGRGVSRSQLEDVEARVGAAAPEGGFRWRADRVVLWQSHLPGADGGPLRHEPVVEVPLA